MAKTIEELLAMRPVDQVAVDAHKKLLLDEVRAYRLREASDLTQVELAARRRTDLAAGYRPGPAVPGPGTG